MDVVDPRAQLSQSWSYNFNQGSGAPLSTGYSSKEVGEVEEDAGQLWGAVLSNDGDWDPTIQGSNGKLMYPLRSTRTVPKGSLTIAQMIMTRSYGVLWTPTSSIAARGYLSDYCYLHDIEDQKIVASMAATLIIVAKHDSRPIGYRLFVW